MSKKIALFASGDLRLGANQVCWSAQEQMERQLGDRFAQFGYEIVRAHPYKEDEKHGFLASQREGMDAFSAISPDMPVIIAEAVWQYSHHVLPGLTSHKGPILTVANWSGQWPGLVGMLNLNGSLTKAGVEYSTLWSEDFEDEFFLSGAQNWLETGKILHDLSHVNPFKMELTDPSLRTVVSEIAADLKLRKSIMGVFDEGCMGMYNAIIPDELLMKLGVFKERLSQSALYYATKMISDTEAEQVFEGFVARNLKFHFGKDPDTELTKDQVLEQCKMYIAVVRLADEFKCETVGIQYQQGLKDLLPASDLVEGTLNNDDRPDVYRTDGTPIRAGQAIVHFNEVDECAGLDALLINRVHRALGQPVETTLHDIRWGDFDQSGTIEDFVWVFEISGAAPPAHHIGGWAGSESLRQPPMYFPSGGGTLRGVAKPGEIVWSRIYVKGNALHMDIGRGKVVALPKEETERRWNNTTREWPIMHGILDGVGRNQLMASHQSNHIQVVYADTESNADRCAIARAKLAQELDIEVNWVGTPIDH